MCIFQEFVYAAAAASAHQINLRSVEQILVFTKPSALFLSDSRSFVHHFHSFNRTAYTALSESFLFFTSSVPPFQSNDSHLLLSCVPRFDRIRSTQEQRETRYTPRDDEDEDDDADDDYLSRYSLLFIRRRRHCCLSRSPMTQIAFGLKVSTKIDSDHFKFRT